MDRSKWNTLGVFELPMMKTVQRAVRSGPGMTGNLWSVNLSLAMKKYMGGRVMPLASRLGVHRLDFVIFGVMRMVTMSGLGACNLWSKLLIP